jgi:hypothetical protein
LAQQVATQHLALSHQMVVVEAVVLLQEPVAVLAVVVVAK